MFKQLFSYAFINVLNAAVPFMLLPFLTYFLLPEDFGALSLIQVLIVMLFPLIILNSHSLILVEKEHFNSNELKWLCANISYISILMFIVLEFVVFIFIDDLIKFTQAPLLVLYLLPLILFFQALAMVCSVYFQSQQAIKGFAIVKLSFTISSLLLTLLFVASLDLGWEGRVYAICAAALTSFSISLFYMIKFDFFNSRPAFNDLIKITKYGLALLPHTFAGIMLGAFDKLVLAKLGNLELLGVYNAGFQTCLALSILFASMNQAWQPNFYRMMKQDGKAVGRQIKLIIVKIGLGMVILTALFLIIAPFIIDMLFDGPYLELKKILPMLALSFLFQGFYFLASNFLFYQKKAKQLSSATLVALIISSVLNYITIPQYGIVGASVVMLITYLSLLSVTCFQIFRVYPLIKDSK